MVSATWVCHELSFTSNVGYALEATLSTVHFVPRKAVIYIYYTRAINYHLPVTSSMHANNTLHNPFCANEDYDIYLLYLRIPIYFSTCHFQVFISEKPHCLSGIIIRSFGQ